MTCHDSVSERSGVTQCVSGIGRLCVVSFCWRVRNNFCSCRYDEFKSCDGGRTAMSNVPAMQTWRASVIAPYVCSLGFIQYLSNLYLHRATIQQTPSQWWCRPRRWWSETSRARIWHLWPAHTSLWYVQAVRKKMFQTWLWGRIISACLQACITSTSQS